MSIIEVINSKMKDDPNYDLYEDNSLTTKQFMEYLESLPKGKTVGSRKELLNEKKRNC
ncbi:unannotated protein [freshwater metagenome]|jgi:hypothetical protein|uniref:Unannotated protein n=1 Tax=freshwater metagenome TaxID=449393 RepID=A0A6J7UJK8_9ZZZZ